MIKNKKGQALVEFIIILPFFVMIVLSLIDFGKIFYTKSNLEGVIDKVITMYNDGNSYEQMNNYISKNISNSELKITKGSDKYISIEIKKSVDIFTPGLNIILKNPYYATARRVMPNE